MIRGAGRAGPTTLSWTRANRSGRSFDAVVESLAAGRQPDVAGLAEVGYLVRNVYYQANGMNGTRMFAAYDADHPLSGVYAVQMIGLYLMRQFSLDLVEHIARARSSSSARLDTEIARFIGVGNSTGIGLNLLVENHPLLISRWLDQRELALAHVKDRVLDRTSPAVDRLDGWLARAATYRRQDVTDYGDSALEGPLIAAGLDRARGLVAEFARDGTIAQEPTTQPWRRLCEVLEERLDVHSIETLHSLLIEACPEVADALAPHGVVSESVDVVPHMRVHELRQLVEADYGWALEIDQPAHWLWYRSAAAEEPRMAVRTVDYLDPDRDEITLDLPGQVQALWGVLDGYPSSATVAELLCDHPARRQIVARVQSLAGHDYHTVRASFLDREFSPIHLSRFVLGALKGLDKVYGMGDRWVRGVFLQGAPTAAEIEQGADEDWIYPDTEGLA